MTLLQETQPRKKILLGHLAARGDCLYATTVARQIKHDFPDCHLTWAIGSMCTLVLRNNPHVDEIWEIPLNSHQDIASAWQQFEKQLAECKQQNKFDEVFLTQVYPANFQNFDGTIRASIFRGYPKPITVPVYPVINLADDEIANVASFAEQHNLKKYSQVILFEFTANSGQSFVTADFALAISSKLVEIFPNLAVVLSSHVPITTDHSRIIDASPLSFRENVELSKYCHLLIGCSSGITWLCTSEWAKPLPMIQLLKKEQSIFASISHDFKHFGLSSTRFIEMTECSIEHVVNCVITFFNNGFDDAHTNYNEKIHLNFDYYFSSLNNNTNLNQIEKYYESIFNTYKRYGSAFIPFLRQHLEREAHELKIENEILKQACQERLDLINNKEKELTEYKKTIWYKIYIRLRTFTWKT